MRVLPLVLALFPTMLPADDIPLSSDVESVTLYPKGAAIVRNVPFSVPAGRHQLILTDLPTSTPLGSVRVEVAGATMGSVTTRRDFVPPRDARTTDAIEAAEAKVKSLEDDLRNRRGAIARTRLEADAARARAAFLEQLGSGEGLSQLAVPDLRRLAGMIGEETLSALQAAHDATLRADQAERGLEELEEQLEKARQALEALVPEDEDRALLAVAVETEAATEGTLMVTYTTGAAGWTPVYDLKLSRKTGGLEIERGAFLYQTTGENWKDIAVTLSTIRPAEQTVPSEIWPWLRRIYDPTAPQPEPAPRLQAEADGFTGAVAEPAMEEEAISVTKAEAEIDGIAVTYEYPGDVSVASEADRVRLALGTLKTRADLVAQAVPLGDSSAFLVARITNDTGELILPTHEAMFYLDGRFVGRQFLPLIPSGDEAELSFGPIDGLRLRRTVLGRSEGDRGVISKSSDLAEEVRIEIDNLTGEAWPVRLLDRVPYSEQEDLDITWSATLRPAEENVDGKRGVMAWEFDLPAGDSRQIVLRHRLEWPEDMELR